MQNPIPILPEAGYNDYNVENHIPPPKKAYFSPVWYNFLCIILSLQPGIFHNQVIFYWFEKLYKNVMSN